MSAPVAAGARSADQYDGVGREALRTLVRAPALALYAAVGSTMDAAHALAAAGAPHGLVVLADVQTGGRGRAGRSWASSAGTGVWCTVVARDPDVDALGVLSLRVGLALAGALAPLAAEPIRVKWPNDLLVGGRKLAGVLVEARWHGGRPEWAAVGVGVNVRAPEGFDAAATLRPGVTRVDALAAIVPAVSHAAAAVGALRAAELAAFAERDAVFGRPVLAPVVGRAAGVSPDGALRVEGVDGRGHLLRDATVVYGAPVVG